MDEARFDGDFSIVSQDHSLALDLVFNKLNPIQRTFRRRVESPNLDSVARPIGRIEDVRFRTPNRYCLGRVREQLEKRHVSIGNGVRQGS